MGSSFSSKVVFQATLPFRCLLVESSPSPEVLSQISCNNIELLNVLGFIEEPRLDLTEDVSEYGKQLSRLDSKVSFLITLLSGVLAERLALPDTGLLKISSKTIQLCSVQDLPADGQAVKVEIFISPIVPSPLVLFGTIKSIPAETQGAECCYEVCLSPLADNLKVALDKMIFRHHRRQVAAQRNQQK